ncbi:MAG: hypothetical protein IKM00_03015 [Clostridia bacterium]|nr:hypothetical protein [Clostridia bacterium]
MRKNKKTRKLYKSAAMGKPAAMYRLGIRLQLGSHGQPDLQGASAWIAAAAEAGYAPAVEWIRDYGFDDGAHVQAES